MENKEADNRTLETNLDEIEIGNTQFPVRAKENVSLSKKGAAFLNDKAASNALAQRIINSQNSATKEATSENESQLSNEGIPDYYVKVEQPYYQGDGNLSVSQLQTLCKQFSEYNHQTQIRLHYYRTKTPALEARVKELEEALREAYNWHLSTTGRMINTLLSSIN